jgi:hypothetical protein
MKRYWIFFLLFFLFSCNSKIQRQIAREQIINLKENGCLIVRLQPKAEKIETLRKIGLEFKAEREKVKIESANKNLMNAFRSEYDFSPVQFIYPDQSIKIKKEMYDQLLYVNDSLKADSTIREQTEYVLTAELGKTTQDTGRYYDKNYLYRAKEGLVEREGYEGESNIGLSGIIVKSGNFVQLHKPFPFYVRKYFLLFNRTERVIVRRLNRKMGRFYKRSSRYLKRQEIKEQLKLEKTDVD